MLRVGTHSPTLRVVCNGRGMTRSVMSSAGCMAETIGRSHAEHGNEGFSAERSESTHDNGYTAGSAYDERRRPHHN